jgi:hypothetical protein
LQLLTDVIRDLLDNWTQISLEVRQLVGGFMMDFIKVLSSSRLPHEQVKEMMTSIIESFLQCSGKSGIEQGTRTVNLIHYYSYI